jgi:outer membrane receptor protein involved in Fe transport
VNFTNVVFDANNNNPVIAAPVKISPQRVMTAWSESFNKTRYALLQFTAKYLDNKVVLTQALRRDNNKGTTKSSLAALGSLPTDWNNSTVYYRPDAPADYFALTYVPKNTSTGAVIGAGRAQQALTRPTTTVAGLASNNPIFANDRFRNDYNNPASNVSGNTFSTGIVYRPLKWFSPQANYSNSQTPPSSTSLDMIGNVRKPVKADGYDMGFGLTFFNGKLSMKFNYFKDTRMNDSVAAPVASPINALYQANRFDDPDTTSTGRNALGFPDLPGNDYQSTRNDGREIDISANLLPGWRFTANSSWTFKVNSDRYPIAKTFVPANADSFKLLLEDAGGRLDTTQKPELAPHAPGLAVANPLPGFGLGVDTTSAVNAYNNIWINYEDVLSSRVARAPQQPTINLFNDYTIQSGVLKDLRIGAGIQWQGRVILGNYGNQTMLDPNNPIPTAIDDPRVSNFDYRFMKGSYKTKFQLGYKFKNVVGNPLTLNLTIDNIVNNTRHVMGDAGLGGGTGFGGVFRQPEANLNLPNRIPSPDLISRFQDPINWSINGTYSFGGGTRGR